MIKSRIFYLLLGILIGSLFFATLSMAGSQVRLVVNGTDITDHFDYKPLIINERTYVPARPLAEALGATVTWDSTRNAVIVNMANQQAPIISTNEFTGTWSYADDQAGWGFALDLVQHDNKVFGEHFAYSGFGNRLDSSYDDITINGEIIGPNKASVRWKSGYGDAEGTASLILHSNGSLEWEIEDLYYTGSFREYYIPHQAILNPN
ncbi:copper amine oxidase N-terminal domain-containing protein [Heliorestis acidaminivorans]|uniref:Copper amine oxidase N-terminal domain-containing protein n=1 Tax=Heliorestis acidaminivorans TaxID=553427 RepID=A0A6I0F5Z9_9FIRM|nr:copper amine oxidase N-terminal domain-containing protein [Heliorestis acidaminivorans]KAB2954257.1 copper amine oxidase N-terminal domain-containing protein [Heliorestis acidaminivorans]